MSDLLAAASARMSTAQAQGTVHRIRQTQMIYFFRRQGTQLHRASVDAEDPRLLGTGGLPSGMGIQLCLLRSVAVTGFEPAAFGL